LAVQPPTAEVFLDGVLVGRAEEFTAAKGGLPLTAGGHLLRFEADECIPELIDVVVADKVTPVEVKLLLRPLGPKK
jgi:hypothetical protein